MGKLLIFGRIIGFPLVLLGPLNHMVILMSLQLVKDLLIPGTNTWNETLINRVIAPEDRSLVKLVRPSIIGLSDSVSWIYSNKGHYSVKSGYCLLRKQANNHISSANNNASHLLFKIVWNVNFPPKVNHFWWRALHDALPVTDNLMNRRMRVDNNCQLCGEAAETVNP